MKKVVIEAAREALNGLGDVTFRVDPEAVRDKRCEPFGSHPSEGTAHMFLDNSGLGVSLVFVVKYDGETHRETRDLDM